MDIRGEARGRRGRCAGFIWFQVVSSGTLPSVTFVLSARWSQLSSYCWCFGAFFGSAVIFVVMLSEVFSCSLWSVLESGLSGVGGHPVSVEVAPRLKGILMVLEWFVAGHVKGFRPWDVCVYRWWFVVVVCLWWPWLVDGWLPLPVMYFLPSFIGCGC